MGYTTPSKAGESTGRQLKKFMTKPEHDYLIRGKPKKKTSMRPNTGKSTYRKNA